MSNRATSDHESIRLIGGAHLPELIRRSLRRVDSPRAARARQTDRQTDRDGCGALYRDPSVTFRRVKLRLAAYVSQPTTTTTTTTTALGNDDEEERTERGCALGDRRGKTGVCYPAGVAAMATRPPPKASCLYDRCLSLFPPVFRSRRSLFPRAGSLFPSVGPVTGSAAHTTGSLSLRPSSVHPCFTPVSSSFRSPLSLFLSFSLSLSLHRACSSGAERRAGLAQAPIAAGGKVAEALVASRRISAFRMMPRRSNSLSLSLSHTHTHTLSVVPSVSPFLSNTRDSSDRADSSSGFPRVLPPGLDEIPLRRPGGLVPRFRGDCCWIFSLCRLIAVGNCLRAQVCRFLGGFCNAAWELAVGWRDDGICRRDVALRGCQTRGGGVIFGVLCLRKLHGLVY